MSLQMSGQVPGGYVRQLSLNHAVETVASAGYKRELFVNMADSLLAVHFQAAPEQKLHLEISLESEIRYEKIKNCEDTVLLSGRAPSYVAPPYYDCPEPVVYEAGKGIRQNCRHLRREALDRSGNGSWIIRKQRSITAMYPICMAFIPET